MAIELNFSKSDSNTPWGFRLTGGADFDVPLAVVKVTENSIAENAGLQVNDVLVRINDTSTAGLTHIEAHDILYNVGNSFILAVRRDDVSNFLSTIANEQETDVEVSKILQEENSLQIKDEIHLVSSSSAVHQEISERSVSETVVEQNIAREEKSINELTQIIKEEETSLEAQERKWSTFLQKPNNPKPERKKKVEDDAPTGEPYRVIIKKQKKKSPRTRYLIAEKQNAAETEAATEFSNITETEEHIDQETDLTIMEQEETSEDIQILHHENMEFSGEVEMQAEISVKVTEEISVEVTEGTSEQERIEAIQESDESETVEEQLLQVQQQLQALSKLPSTIQESLDVITQQLSKIVSSKLKKDNEDDKQVSEAGTETESDITEQANAEGSETSGTEENLEAEDKEQQDEDDNVEQEARDDDQNSDDNGNKTDDHISDEELENNEEEIEAERLEKLKKEKEEKEKIEEQKSRMPLKPIDRPIILPGGRRWSQPDDACPAIRHPKMSDEKIANTIETYSEVISGRTKGMSNYFTESLSSNNVSGKKINFLKYQPPPKNLDYLQKSEVFKLLHDIERPVKGICSRASKILAEEDYYQQARESP